MVVHWFKKDFRLKDHAPLKRAIEHAFATGQPIALIYIWEPLLLHSADYDLRHWRFVRQSIDALNEQLAKYGHRVQELYGKAVSLFPELHQRQRITELYSHQEIGLATTFKRDLAVQKWCTLEGITWTELPTDGVRRGLKNRRDYTAHWNAFMEAPFEDPDLSQLKHLSGIELNQNNEARVHLAAEILQDHQDFQRGGELEGRTWLKSFIRERSNKYAQTISLPEESRFHNSRLSPYLSWGNLSVRQVHQTFKKHVVSDHPNRFGIRACHQRLIWRSHFVQKFESECRMEFENINSAYNRLDRAHDAALLERWKEGVTGFPLVDASMRCVNATGWLNFRMRAMVISFLTHYLWQHWREGAVWLGSRFLDFEPGIHYPQVQMQAASTGIHTVRVYNPIKQAKEKDPDGVFIRRWVPELAALPTQYVHQPSAAPPLELAFQNIELGKDYPLPMVEAKIAHKKATDALWEIKNNAETRREGRKIMKKHVKPGRRWQ